MSQCYVSMLMNAVIPVTPGSALHGVMHYIYRRVTSDVSFMKSFKVELLQLCPFIYKCSFSGQSPGPPYLLRLDGPTDRVGVGWGPVCSRY